MSHEIRTPLNGVLGLAQLLEREPLQDAQQAMVQRIQSAGHSLLGIINDILDFSKIESGRMTVEWQPFALDQTLAKLDGLLRPGCEAKGLTLQMPRIPDDLRVLRGDALRLEQVLMNLLSNAIKFTENGQITVSVDVLPAASRTRLLRFEIRDTGIGISPELLAELFTPFTQGEAGITRRFGGTGLGLSIARRLVQLMGGVIGVESEEGKGSLFWFELPFDEVEPAQYAPRPDSPPRQRAHRRLEGLHCLVVDDSAMNRGLVEQILTMEGATVETAEDGQAAVDRLGSHPDRYDVVLMDVQMPVMDGLTATRLIRRELHLPDLPVIALTAGVLPQQREAARDAGVTDFLPKPLDLEELTVCLLKWTGRAVEPEPIGPEMDVSSGNAAPSASFAPPLQAVPFAGPVIRQAATPDPVRAAHAEVDPMTPDFPEIAGIDRQRAARTLGGNRAFFLRLLRDFADEYAGFAERVRTDLAGSDGREIAARRLHTLRGNAGNIGAMALMQAAGDLEQAVRQGEVGIEARLESLSAQITALMLACAPWRVVTDDSAAGTESTSCAWDADRFAALCTALQNNQFAARRLFEELQPALRLALGNDAIVPIAEAVRALRYREALELLQALPATGQAGNLS